nr:hypothetical protein CFP56_36322 [Quercus suber]
MRELVFVALRQNCVSHLHFSMSTRTAMRLGQDVYEKSLSMETRLPITIHRPIAIVGDNVPRLDILHSVSEFAEKIKDGLAMSALEGKVQAVDVTGVASVILEDMSMSNQNSHRAKRCHQHCGCLSNTVNVYKVQSTGLDLEYITSMYLTAIEDYGSGRHGPDLSRSSWRAPFLSTLHFFDQAVQRPMFRSSIASTAGEFINKSSKFGGVCLPAYRCLDVRSQHVRNQQIGSLMIGYRPERADNRHNETRLIRKPLTTEAGKRHQHKKYGSILQTGTNVIHVSDPTFYNEMFRSATHRRIKSSLWSRMDGRTKFDDQSMFMTMSHEHYRIRKRGLRNSSVPAINGTTSSPPFEVSTQSCAAPTQARPIIHSPQLVAELAPLYQGGIELIGPANELTRVAMNGAVQNFEETWSNGDALPETILRAVAQSDFLAERKSLHGHQPGIEYLILNGSSLDFFQYSDIVSNHETVFTDFPAIDDSDIKAQSRIALNKRTGKAHGKIVTIQKGLRACGSSQNDSCRLTHRPSQRCTEADTAVRARKFRHVQMVKIVYDPIGAELIIARCHCVKDVREDSPIVTTAIADGTTEYAAAIRIGPQFDHCLGPEAGSHSFIPEKHARCHSWHIQSDDRCSPEGIKAQALIRSPSSEISQKMRQRLQVTLMSFPWHELPGLTDLS